MTRIPLAREEAGGVIEPRASRPWGETASIKLPEEPRRGDIRRSMRGISRLFSPGSFSQVFAGSPLIYSHAPSPATQESPVNDSRMQLS